MLECLNCLIGSDAQNCITLIVVQAKMNKKRSNKTDRKKSVSCAGVLRGSGSWVISIVMDVKVNPLKSESTLERFER